MKSLWIACLAVLGCISGCSDKQTPVPKTADTARLFNTQREALQRAKGVEPVSKLYNSKVRLRNRRLISKGIEASAL